MNSISVTANLVFRVYSQLTASASEINPFICCCSFFWFWDVSFLAYWVGRKYNVQNVLAGAGRFACS